MLESMGWQEGQGLGRTKKGRINYVKVKHRAEGLGLGANTFATDTWATSAHGFGELLADLNAVFRANQKRISDERGGKSKSGKSSKRKRKRDEDVPEKRKSKKKRENVEKSEKERKKSKKLSVGVAGHANRYKKRTATKMVRNYSASEMSEIFGEASPFGDAIVAPVQNSIVTEKPVKKEKKSKSKSKKGKKAKRKEKKESEDSEDSELDAPKINETNEAIANRLLREQHRGTGGLGLAGVVKKPDWCGTKKVFYNSDEEEKAGSGPKSLYEDRVIEQKVTIEQHFRNLAQKKKDAKALEPHIEDPPAKKKKDRKERREKKKKKKKDRKERREKKKKKKSKKTKSEPK